MGSSEQQSQKSARLASSSEAQQEPQAHQTLPESVSSAGEHMNQQTDSTVETVSSHTTSPSETEKMPVKSVDPAPVDSSSVESTESENAVNNETLDTAIAESDEADISRQVPIPPASEPMQYRAIGLIWGKYVPSEEQFTRGIIVTEDKADIDAVLLGRVMSLVKKHIELEENHLWVVYPRTRNKDSYLHAQIVGIWEPEKLNRETDGDELGEEASDGENSPSEDLTAAAEVAETSQPEAVAEEELSADAEPDDQASAIASDASTIESAAESDPEATVTADVSEEPAESAKSESDPESAPAAAATPEAAETDKEDTADALAQPSLPGAEEALRDGYFSIRGEVIKQSPEEGNVTVKIRQAPRKGATQPRAFTLVLKGNLEGRAVGYFWELNVQREGSELVVHDGTMIALVPPRKGGKGQPRKGGRGGPRSRGRHPGGGSSGGGKRRWEGRSPSRPSGDRPSPSRPDGSKRPSKPQRRSANADAESSQSNG